MMRLVVFLGTIGAAAAHGAMVSPAPRNAIDSELPAWDHGKHTPRTGVIEPLEVGCTNGTEPCAVGQSVFWFSQVSFQSGSPMCCHFARAGGGVGWGWVGAALDHEPALSVRTSRRAFQQGCTPGCKSCDGNGTRFANWDHCADERSTPYKPTLAPQYRTALRHTVPGSPEDIW